VLSISHELVEDISEQECTDYNYQDKETNNRIHLDLEIESVLHELHDGLGGSDREE
jgi:hypothetical protein